MAAPVCSGAVVDYFKMTLTERVVMESDGIQVQSLSDCLLMFCVLLYVAFSMYVCGLEQNDSIVCLLKLKDKEGYTVDD